MGMESMDMGDIWLPQKIAPMPGKILGTIRQRPLTTGGLLTPAHKLTIPVTRKVTRNIMVQALWQEGLLILSYKNQESRMLYSPVYHIQYISLTYEIKCGILFKYVTLLPSTSLHTLHASIYIQLYHTCSSHVHTLYGPLRALCDYVLGGLRLTHGCAYGRFLDINPATCLIISPADVNIYINLSLSVRYLKFGHIGSIFSYNSFLSLACFMHCVIK